MDFSQASDTKKIRQTTKSIDNLKHRKKIADAMAPDPTKWEYSGDCVDAGPYGAKCTCGHPIRYVFYITKDDKMLPLGSTCIETTVPHLIACGANCLAEKLQAAQQKLKKEIRDKFAAKKKRQRDHENNKIVSSMIQDIEEMIDVHKKFRLACYESGIYMPYYFYRPLRIPGACKTTGHTLNRLKKFYTENVISWIRSSREEGYKCGSPAIPVPKNDTLLTILLEAGSGKNFKKTS